MIDPVHNPRPAPSASTTMIGKLDDYLRFNEMALSLRSQRQELLASNIANADTPNYKARDIDFSSALQNAVTRAGQGSAQGGAGKLATTAPAHIAGTGAAADGKALADGTPVLYRTVTQGAVDGNTVEMDTERTQFADNALRYEAGITMINQQIRNMMNAVQSAGS